MDGYKNPTEQFEAHRAHLRTVAYGMLGSLTEADDAVQETWLRFTRADIDAVDNLGGWLTTVIARICLDMLRSRVSRREQPLDSVSDPPVNREQRADPEQQALLADSVGVALLVVLQTLSPSERLAFVLHDLFGVPFDEIARLLGSSPPASRQAASRARRRVRGAVTLSDADRRHQQEIVEAFLLAAREGDFDALVALLAPDVVVRADDGTTPPGAWRQTFGARRVAKRALAFSRRVPVVRLALVNGKAGLVAQEPDGRTSAVMEFTVRQGRILRIDILTNPQRLHERDPVAFSMAAVLPPAAMGG